METKEAPRTEIHQAAARGFSAGVSRYTRGRPDYPPQIDVWLKESLGLGYGKRVVDLGAGTGKFSSRLLATGAEVLAIEPVAAMREQLAAHYPNIEARDGTAECLPLADASVDAVVCAQSFHWFATQQALNEIRRVLKPDGILGLVWNVRDERVNWVAALTALMAPYEGDAPRYHTGRWRQLFPAQGFGPLREHHISHGHTGPAEQVIVDRLLSVSFIAALPSADQEKFVTQVHALIAATPEMTLRSEVTFPYDTAAFSCRKIKD